MRAFILGLGLVLSTSAFAAAPKGTGNFRRAEAIKAAGTDAKGARVIGMATSQRSWSSTPASPRTSRVLFVEGSDGKVAVVNAPINKDQAVRKLTTAQVNGLGLITQAQARAQASKANGKLGQGRVAVENAGFGVNERSSYIFKQTSPASVVYKEYGHTYRGSNITRSVSMTGKGESAAVGKVTRLDK